MNYSKDLECNSVDTPTPLAIKKIQKLCDPFKNCPWSDEYIITKKEIKEKISKGSVLSLPSSSEFEKEQHIERIAYLVLNHDPTPIDIDVGVPSLGYYPKWIIEDGNHRLSAAIYRQEKYIFAYCSGEDRVIEGLKFYHLT